MFDITKNSQYSLLDSGDGEKLERFGEFLLRRPDPEVLWHKKKPIELWESADAFFKKDGLISKWRFKNKKVTEWKISFCGVNLLLKLNNFKHIGLFPEQFYQSKWMTELISSKIKEKPERQIRILNLFGYTGLSSVVLAKAGALVTHIDASKATIDWANINKSLNQADKDLNIRFILDDAKKFVDRELRRGSVYDGIFMDPPVYGNTKIKGKGKATWLLDKDLLDLIEKTVKLFSKEPIFFAVSGYASHYSHLSYKNAVYDILNESLNDNLKDKLIAESGELSIEEEGSQRVLPAGIFARGKFL